MLMIAEIVLRLAIKVRDALRRISECVVKTIHYMKK